MRRYGNNIGYFFIKGHVAALLILAISLVAIISINVSLKPVALAMGSQYGLSSLSETVSQAVKDFFCDEEIGYSDIVRLNYNSSGFVTSAEYDTNKINILKSLIEARLIKALDKYKTVKIKIPLGSVSNDINLSGKGPCLKLRLITSGVPRVDVISDFASVGINTVKHEIILRITVDCQLYLPPKKESFSLTQDYVIAKTIIVGDIPSGYADVG